jgi:hypothetical protein
LRCRCAAVGGQIRRVLAGPDGSKIALQSQIPL